MLKLILETPGDQFVGQALIALAVNLSANPNNSEKVMEGEGLRLLIQRVKKTSDPLLMKMVRNMSHHEGKCKDTFMVNSLSSYVGNDSFH